MKNDCLPSDGEHVLGILEETNYVWFWRRGRTSWNRHLSSWGKSRAHGQDGEDHKPSNEVRNTPGRGMESLSFNNAVKHDWEDQTTARRARDDDTHRKRASPPEMVGDDSDGGQKEETECDACTDSLSEEDLIVLALVCEGEHVVAEDVEGRSTNHHWVKVASIKELAGDDTHGELEEKLD